MLSLSRARRIFKPQPEPDAATALARILASALGVLTLGAMALRWRSFRTRRAARRAVQSELLPPPAVAEQHDRKVRRIAALLRSRSSARPLSLRKQTVAHQVPKGRDLRHRDDKVDIGALNQILEIDPAGRTCVAESGVTFIDLVAATMRHGLIPIIVPELKTITIGGAVSGCSIGSMSFLHGGFHDTCLEYEVITSTGEVLTCRPDGPHSLLFQMMHSSFGTLGILSKLRSRLTPAKPYVKMTCEKYPTFQEYVAAIQRHCSAQDIELMDGFVHSPTEYVLCIGHFVDEAPYRSRYDWVKVYYQTTRERQEDHLTTEDYLFRYDRGVTNVHPRSAIGRFFFGKLLGSSQLLGLAEKLHFLLDDGNPTVILDVFIPIARAEEFLNWYKEEFQFFPLWCVPYRRVRVYEWIADGFAERMPGGEFAELFLDIAVYGMKQHGDRNYHKIMEDKLRELGGIKTLISHNHYTEEELWTIWNRENYSKAKALADPHNVFRDLYTKTCRAMQALPG